MSILITGIDMPTKGNPITVLIYPDGTAEWEAQNKVGTAIPVLKHGRLIDADDFERNNQYFWNRDFINPKCEDTLADLVNAAPTVIPASEEGE